MLDREFATDARLVAPFNDQSGLLRLSRSIDIALALIGIIATLPLFVILGLTVFATGPGPVIFAQRRIGRDGERFWCLKFRTMCVDSTARLQALLASDPAARLEWQRDHKLRRDPRVTTVGRFLRASSLDELPQLYNVLFGQMSFVGPRPIVEAEIPRYGRYFQAYCSVRPGITGLWQIGGRNDVSYRRRVALDVTYVQNKCVLFDLRILALTVPRVLLSRGAY